MTKDKIDKLEYHVDVIQSNSNYDLECKLNNYGEQGWELVDFSPTESQWILRCVFKRPALHKESGPPVEIK